MKKIRKVLEFILALLNFMFHFKPTPDETPSISPETFPRPGSLRILRKGMNLYLRLSVRIRLW